MALHIQTNSATFQMLRRQHLVTFFGIATILALCKHLPFLSCLISWSVYPFFVYMNLDFVLLLSSPQLLPCL